MTRDDHPIPPSFTPQAGRSGRPDSASDAIAVDGSTRSPRGEARISRRDDAVPVEPRVRRQSSREIPVTPPERRPAASDRKPKAYPPAAPTARRVGGRPVPASNAPRQSSGTRVMPAAPAQRGGTGGGPSAGRGPGGGRLPGNGGVGGAAVAATGPAGGGFRIRKGRVAALVLVLLLVLLLAWPVGLLIWANGKIQHVDALSGADGTPGTTYLLAGSDERGTGGIDDGTSGARTDTILLLHDPASGPTSLISIPRDTYAEIPGEGNNKINAAYAWGGAPLLVKTVEQLTGLTVDHYAEVGFGSVQEIVDAVGGVRLCLDYDVDDERSELRWTAGCHTVGGKKALAFSRMRYADPDGDIGRAERQRQLIGAVSKQVADPGVLWNPATQVTLVKAGTNALTVDDDTGIIDLARLALAFRAANGPDGVTGTPPIADPGYDAGDGSGSTVLLDPETVDQFWADLRDGNLEPGSTVGGLPG